MRRLAPILFVIFLFGCAHSPEQNNKLTDINTFHRPYPSYPQPLIKEEINSFSLYSERYEKYHIVNVNNSVFHVSNVLVKDCYTEKSYIPKVKRIPQGVWQRARKKDGEVIDACAYKFKALKEKTLNIVTEIKK